MKRFPGLHMAINFAVNGTMQQGKSHTLFVDVSTLIQHAPESIQIFHFHCLMGRR